jgi:tetratricopeptide (TPR) repeat protein
VTDIFESAIRGDADAQYALGLSYFNGKNVPKDYDQALKWFRRAADQGHTQAQWQLGSFYEVGLVVHEDRSTAAKWYRKAAESGHAEAQFRLGSLCADGLDMLLDEAEALEWFVRAITTPLALAAAARSPWASAARRQERQGLRRREPGPMVSCRLRAFCQVLTGARHDDPTATDRMLARRPAGASTAEGAVAPYSRR